MATRTTTPADTKILKDLETLTEKMELCQSMLNPGAGDPKLSLESEAMLAVVGFLEACSPRVVELVEAAATGALSEEVFAECLTANDNLQKLLGDVETAAMTETSAATTAASAPAASSALTEQFEDLLLGASEPATGGKTTGEEEDSKQPATDLTDDFDAFFTERTNKF